MCVFVNMVLFQWSSSLAFAHKGIVHTVKVSNVVCLCLFWHFSTIHTLQILFSFFFASLVSHAQNRSLHHCRSSLSVTAWFWFYVFHLFFLFVDERARKEIFRHTPNNFLISFLSAIPLNENRSHCFEIFHNFLFILNGSKFSHLSICNSKIVG